MKVTSSLVRPGVLALGAATLFLLCVGSLLALQRQDTTSVLQQNWILVSLGLIPGLILAAAAWGLRWPNGVGRRTEQTPRDSGQNYRRDTSRPVESGHEHCGRVEVASDAAEKGNTGTRDSRSVERSICVEKEGGPNARARVQENFLAHVSHELRTPLTAIYFFTTNLLDGLLGDLTAEQHQQLELALNNVCQLKDMVSDLIDVSRIETHKLTLNPKSASPAKLIAVAVSTCCTNAIAKNITLLSDVGEVLPFVWADSSRVRQILINLIDNAIKFTRDGGAVTVGSRPSAEGEAFLTISVSDTGCGISQENLEIIFDRLAQLEGGTAASRSGLGLGLFITKELVQLQGGRIWVESAAGKGSTFHFTLPLFSLAKLCARIFTAPNLRAGHVTLIAVDVSAVDGAGPEEIQMEMRRVLSLCIHPAQDLLLPPISDAEPLGTYFIVACTGVTGSAIIANRISRELQDFDSASRLKPVISATTLLVLPDTTGETQIGEVTGRIEKAIQSHLVTGPSVGSLFLPNGDGSHPVWGFPGQSDGKPMSNLVN